MISQADATWRGVLCHRKMASAVWGMNQHRDSGGCSSLLSPEPPPQPLVHFALILLEPRVSGFKWSICLSFHSWMLSEFLSLFLCCRLGYPAWSLDPTLFRGKTLATDISLWNFSCYHGSPASPLTPPLHCLSLIWWCSGFFFLSLFIRPFSS